MTLQCNSRVSTMVSLHHLDSKFWIKSQMRTTKNVPCCYEHIQEATTNKIAVVLPLTSYLAF